MNHSSKRTSLCQGAKVELCSLVGLLPLKAFSDVCLESVANAPELLALHCQTIKSGEILKESFFSKKKF
jgi:hypothetical protein